MGARIIMLLSGRECPHLTLYWSTAGDVTLRWFLTAMGMGG